MCIRIETNCPIGGSSPNRDTRLLAPLQYLWRYRAESKRRERERGVAQLATSCVCVCVHAVCVCVFVRPCECAITRVSAAPLISNQLIHSK